MRILVIRLSAMGDAVLCLPVLRSALTQNRGLHVDLLTRPFLAPVFGQVPCLEVLPYDMDRDFKGLTGIMRLYSLLRSNRYDMVLDLHDVLRTKPLCWLFLLGGHKVYSIDKERKKKRSLLGKIHLADSSLMHTTERYSRVFRSAGFGLELNPKDVSTQGIVQDPEAMRRVDEWIGSFRNSGIRVIGLAPFSQHHLKEYPLARIREIVRSMSEIRPSVFVVFAAGERELDSARELAGGMDQHFVFSSGMFDLREELALMQTLDVMITMDSANMHLAELAGCRKVVSVWGPTHHALGFSPYFSGTRFIAGIPAAELTCRPCSLYGQTPCRRGDHACMNLLPAERILQLAGSSD